MIVATAFKMPEVFETAPASAPARPLRIVLYSGNYNYVRDGANQALNRLVAFVERQGCNVRVYSPTSDTPAFEPAGTLVSVPSLSIPGRDEYRVALGVPDRQSAGAASEHPHGWRDIWQALKQPNLRRLMLIDLLATLPAGFGGALLVFFFEAARGFSQADARLLLLFYFAAGLIGAPLWGWVARRTSKHMAVAWAIGSYAVLHMGLVLAPNAGFWVAAAGMLLAGIPAVAPPFLVRAMLADVTDAETLATGRSNAGLYYAVLVGVQKLGYAIPVGLAYAVLDAVGFDAKLGAANTQSAIDGLVMLFLVPPVVSAVGAAWLARGWTIDRAAQQQIIAELHGK